MANILRGEAGFSADGVDYRLVVDFNAFAEAEDAADMAVDDLLVALTPVMDAGARSCAGRASSMSARCFSGRCGRITPTSRWRRRPTC